MTRPRKKGYQLGDTTSLGGFSEGVKLHYSEIFGRISTNFTNRVLGPSQLAASSSYLGARLARICCSVRRCILSLRAVSETLHPQS